VGLSHAAVLRHVVAGACTREGLPVPWASSSSSMASDTSASLAEGGSGGGDGRRPTVRVLCGGDTSERQVCHHPCEKLVVRANLNSAEHAHRMRVTWLRYGRLVSRCRYRS
jgi:hypothetical protein